MLTHLPQLPLGSQPPTCLHAHGWVVFSVSPGSLIYLCKTLSYSERNGYIAFNGVGNTLPRYELTRRQTEGLSSRKSSLNSTKAEFRWGELRHLRGLFAVDFGGVVGGGAFEELNMK